MTGDPLRRANCSPSRAKALAFALLAVALWAASAPAWAAPQPGEEQAISAARELGRAFTAVAKHITPSVVNISTTKIIPGRRFAAFDDPIFRYFFRDAPFGDMLQEPERRISSLGSGVIVDPQGHIVTNSHVVRGADEIRVTLYDRTELSGTLVGVDQPTDLAVLKIEADGLKAAKWGDSDALQVGEWVIAVGAPFGLGQTVTAGIVSAKGRTRPSIAGYVDFIQTDAAINPGNSGGALVNLDAELVGINTAIYSQSGGSEGVGFAVPGNTARQIMERLIEDGQVTRGWIGIVVRPLNSRERAALPEEARKGLLISQMVRNSPADTGGLQPGDVLISFGGKRVSSMRELRDLIAASPINTEAEVVVYSPRGKRFDKDRVTVRAQPHTRSGDPFPGI